MSAVTDDAPAYVTRGEFSDVRQDVKTLERQMVEVQTTQGAQSGQLSQIIMNQDAQTAMIRSQGNVRAMIVSACSGLGGGSAVGLYALLHSLGKI